MQYWLATSQSFDFDQHFQVIVHFPLASAND